MSPGVIQMNFQGKIVRRMVWLGIVLPLLLCLWAGNLMQDRPDSNAPTGEEETPSQDEMNEPHKIKLLIEEEVCIMDLEAYLVGVVLAEMPASFEPAALRAQAVTARTYTLKRCREDLRHGQNTVCSNNACCQAYIDPQDYIAAGGTHNSWQRVFQAVADTEGEVLMYSGALIEATYFSCSGGSTEAAVEVWGQQVPYLQAVSSPGEEVCAYYVDRKSLTAEEFQAALGVRLKGEPDTWFGDTTLTQSGGVRTMEIGGVAYRGTTLRTLLGLRSTIFSVTCEDGLIIFETRGNGHRVGLSQYGANAMAQRGYDYQQILSHYFIDTQLVQYSFLE